MKYAYKIFNKNLKIKNIKKVYNDSIKNKPSTGIDGINIECFNKKLNEEINLINEKVLVKSYNFSFYKEKLISKGKNKYPRVISIPTIRDKIVLKIISNTLSEMFEDDMSNELIHTKINKIKTSIQNGKYNSFIKIDIENFYPSINHKLLLKNIKKRTRKKEMIDLIKKATTQETVKKSHKSLKKYTNTKGVPQGLSISNILASIYLINFDKKNYSQENYEYFRYVDDILILCHNTDMSEIFESIKSDINNLNLKIHEEGINDEKTRKGKLEEGFYFLGYHFSNTLISVRESSINNLYNSLIKIFSQYKHSKYKNTDLLYWKLNLKITGCKFEGRKYGWLYFFSQINNKTLLFKLDIFVKNLFDKFDIKYEEKNIKKFIRTYYEILKNRTNTKYIPNFSEVTKKEKKDILENIFKQKDIQDNNIEYKFDKLIYKNIKEMEKDIQMY